MRGMRPRWGYVVTAMVTPFQVHGAIDFVEAVALAKWLLDNGSDALVINGTTGESPTTSRDEKAALEKLVALQPRHLGRGLIGLQGHKIKLLLGRSQTG